MNSGAGDSREAPVGDGMKFGAGDRREASVGDGMKSVASEGLKPTARGALHRRPAFAGTFPVTNLVACKQIRDRTRRPKDDPPKARSEGQRPLIL